MVQAGDWESTISINVVFLKILGLWPKEGLYYTIYWSTCATINLLFTLTLVCNIFANLDDLATLLLTVFYPLTPILSMVKIYYFKRNAGLMKDLIIASRSPYFRLKKGQNVLIVEDLMVWKKVLNVFICCITGTAISYWIVPFLDGSWREFNLPLIAWFPYNMNGYPQYTLSYIFQIVTMFYTAMGSLTMDMFSAALMVLVGTQCDILCDNLRNLEPAKIDDELVHCIKHHKEILEFARKSNEFIGATALGQFVSSAIAIALAMFEISLMPVLSKDFIAMMFFTSAIVVELYVYCHFGTKVILQSGNIPYAAFEADWIDAPITVKKHIIFFIRKTQTPIRMEVLDLFSLSLTTFMKILKSSYSYFALLQQVSSEK